ncbi:MAG: hypothetical protein DDT34_01835 [Firmicutes bacterium]|nr:hypothetical protein [Bacillota bacterium]MBT9166203.1 hypothetical protein [Chloroflexota bacterium]
MTDTSNTRDRGRFCGRSSELKTLQEMFDLVAIKGEDGKFSGPRIVTIVAESGLGKTRLAQELYVRLASDERWNPKYFSYWPNSFGDKDSNLNVVPDLSNQRPKGPPRFLWMGARWRAPTEKNAAITTSALPELRSSLTAHAVVIETHLPAWKAALSRATEALSRVDRAESIGTSGEVVEVFGEFFTAFADILIAGFGTAVKAVSGGTTLVADRLNGPRDYESVKKESNESEGDEFLARLRHLLSHAGALPVVILLDDAQWIDSASFDFLVKLWEGAKRNRWPILVVATHWEREWEELASRSSSFVVTPQTLHELTRKYGTDGKGGGAQELILKPSDDSDLERYLTDQLPGLTEEQRKLLVDKAAGNFLTLIENIGELIENKHNFENGDRSGPLSEEGESEARTWECDRQRRVKERFSKLETRARDLLGWSSYFGQRFIRDVIVEFASKHRGMDDSETLMSRCENPYVILGKAGDIQREFRDRAYHLAATDYFNRYGGKHRDALHQALRQHLAEWVNKSFDERGNSIWPSHEPGAIPAPVRCATHLNPNERRELLAQASHQFRLHLSADWDDPCRCLGLRTLCLAIHASAVDGFWSAVSRALDAMLIGDSGPIPTHILSADEQIYLGGLAHKLGRYELASCLVRSANTGLRYQGKEIRDAEQIRKLLEGIDLLARIERSRGQSDSAISLLGELIELIRKLSYSHENKWHESLWLAEIAECRALKQDFDLSIDAAHESLAIRYELSGAQGISDSLSEVIERSVVTGHTRLGRVEEQRREIGAARAHYEVALDVVRGSKKIKDKAKLEAVVLMDIARIGCSELNDEDSLSLDMEALRLLTSDEEASESPEHQADIGRVHFAISRDHLARGNFAEARKSLASCIELRSKLWSELGGSNNEKDFLLALREDAKVVAKMAEKEVDRSNIDGAYYLFNESLELRRKAFKISGSIDERLFLAAGLKYVGEVEFLRQNFDSALAYFAQALHEIGQPEEWDAPVKRLFALLALSIGKVVEQRGNFFVALEIYRSGLSALRPLASIPGAQDLPLELLWRIASLHQCSNDFEGFVEAATEAIELCHRYDIPLPPWLIAED